MAIIRLNEVRLIIDEHGVREHGDPQLVARLAYEAKDTVQCAGDEFDRVVTAITELQDDVRAELLVMEDLIEALPDGTPRHVLIGALDKVRKVFNDRLNSVDCRMDGLSSEHTITLEIED